MSATVILKSDQALVLKTGLPNGRDLVITFKQREAGGPYFAEVPTVVEYADDFRKKHVAHDNLAQHIIDNYNVEIVDIVEVPQVTGAVVQPKVEKKKPGRPRKDTQDEEVAH